MSPARAQRTRLIRSRIAAAATALFVALFGVIGVRLASGHDPGLAKSATSTTSNSTSTSTGTSSNSSSTQSDQPSLTTSDQPSQAVSPVTTSQS
jgi:hypothetical protein